MATTELAIVGGGAAGLVAALYAARARIETVVIERMGLGGQLSVIDRIENFPGFPDGITGADLAARLARQALDAGAQVVYAEATALRSGADGAPHTLVADAEALQARAIVLACGSSPARLGIPGEEAFVGRGVSSCATCDGDFCRGEPVVVIGGGDSAVDEARYLAGIASSVTLVHRRDALRAERIGQERLFALPNVSVLWNAHVEAILGDETVRAVRVRVDGEATPRDLPAAGVFVYAGLQPNTAWLRGAVAMDAGGHVSANERLETSVPGIFAAGDLRQHSARQLAASAGDGATAAIWAERYLRGPLSR
jgi:thioredoxin reductase (NADPH)